MSLLFIASILALFQGILSPQSQNASVAGMVVKQGTDEPLSKATVTLYPAGLEGKIATYSVTSDANGRFLFASVTPGVYRISADRFNYVRAEYGDRASNGCGTPLLLIAGQQFSNARIVMLPAGVISGHLYDADREGLPNVSAHALKYVYENGRAVFTVVQTVQTNDLGEYRLFGLTPGRYYVAAALETASIDLVKDLILDTTFIPANRLSNAPVFDATVLSGSIKGDRYLPAYFPNGSDPSGARVIELRPGESIAGVDLTATFSHTVRITGKVANSVSREIPRAMRLALVSRLAHPNSGAPVRSASMKPDGTFEMVDVLPGPYFLVATGNDESGTLIGRVPVDVGETNLHNVAIEVSRGFDLQGRVTVDDPNVMKRLVGLTLMPSVTASVRTQPITAKLDQGDGSFKFQAIAPGEYVPVVNFTADGPVDIYVKTLRLGSQDVRDGIRLDAQPSAQLEMAVGNHGAVVEGTVLNDKQSPVAGATVVLVPDIFLRKRSSYYKTARTDASGHFRLSAISPGDYKIFAWEEVETGSWQDPDFLRLYETRGKTLTLPEGVTEPAQVSVIPSAGPLYGQCPGPFMGLR
jgi:Carboxypeptidase regulatory-like domain